MKNLKKTVITSAASLLMLTCTTGVAFSSEILSQVGSTVSSNPSAVLEVVAEAAIMSPGESLEILQVAVDATQAEGEQLVAIVESIMLTFNEYEDREVFVIASAILYPPERELILALLDPKTMFDGMDLLRSRFPSYLPENQIFLPETVLLGTGELGEVADNDGVDDGDGDDGDVRPPVVTGGGE